jgi:hypothetical protein
MKKPSSKARGKGARVVLFEDNKVDFAKFKTELSAVDIAKLTWTGVGIKVWPLHSIELLSPIKTVGRGRTNLTLGTPNIVQTDATTPYADFGRGFVSVHFEPIAYGITSVATYVVTFNIQTSGSATFSLYGFGDTPNAGTYSFNGSWTVQLILRNLQPGQQTYAALEQISGASWKWYSSAIKFPDLIVTQALV